MLISYRKGFLQMRRKNWKVVAAYTALFAVLFALCYGGIALSGRTLIWEIDGLMQHYPFMIYIGRWLRESAHALLTGGRVQAFDFSLGFGEDVLTTMNYYGLGDPLMLVSALFDGASTETGFWLVAALRAWCAGLACMALARYKGFDEKRTVFSGLLYAFSLSMFSAAQIRQTMFVLPYIHFPLMLLGVERVFDRKKPWVLSIAVALSALCGFYFLYCNSVLLLIYALIRQLTRGEKRPFATLPGTAGRALCWYALGIGLAAAVFLPVTAGFLQGQRLSGGMTLSEFRACYSLKEYLRFPLAALSAYEVGAVPFMPAMTLMGASAMLMRRRREDVSWRALTIAMIVMLLIPATGWVLNGFSYEAVRWAYAPALLAAMLGGRAIDDLKCLSKRGACVLTALCALMALYLALLQRTRYHAGSRYTVEALASLAAAWLGFRLLRMKKNAWKRMGAAALAAVSAAGIVAAHALVWDGRADGQMAAGESYAEVSSSVYADLPEQDSFARTDTSIESTREMINCAALEGVAGTAVYNSIISGRYHSMMEETSNAGLVQVNAIVGLDARAALEAVWSVGRYVCASDEGARVPYGFVRTADGVYENENALPIGYAMTQTMTQAEYDALPPLEKQWALLQCAVTDDAELQHAQPEQSAYEIEVVSVEVENAVWNDGALTADEGAVIRLAFDAPAGCELYVELENLAFENGLIDLDNRVTFSCAGVQTYICLMPSGFELDLLDRGAYLVNLGYSAEGRAEAEIRFARAGNYRLNGLKLYVQPMEAFDGMVETLSERGLKDVSIGTNEVSGRASLDEDALMVFSIPYSNGWTAYVDGERVRTTDSADTFLAVPLEAGEHEIVLRYRTPWLRVGAAISAVSLLALIAWGWTAHRRAKGERT